MVSAVELLYGRFEHHAALLPARPARSVQEGFVALSHRPDFRRPEGPALLRTTRAEREAGAGHAMSAPDRGGVGSAHGFGFTVTRGSLRGDRPRSAVIAFADAAAAQRALTRQIKRLVARGYVPGFHEPRLLQAIADAPPPLRDRASSLYARWLHERGDARGELIQRMMEGAPDGEIEALLDAFPVQLRPTWWRDESITVSWHHGFVRAVHIRVLGAPEALGRLFAHPSLALVEELRVVDAPVRIHAPSYTWPSTPTLRADFAERTEDWRRAFRRRPGTLARMLVRSNAYLEAIVAEVPGLVLS